MRLFIVAVGQRVPDWAQTAWDDYAKRFPHELRIELKAVKTEPRGSKTLENLYAAERAGILDEMKQRAVILAEGLNRIPGIQCNRVAGAMYCFPRVTLPAGRTDAEYCMSLLEETGICVVPGSGFGQAPGTAHFRTTILPPVEKLQRVVEALGEFHRNYR